MPRQASWNVDLDKYLANFMDDVMEHCDARKAFEMAPHVPIAGATAVSMFYDKS